MGNAGVQRKAVRPSPSQYAHAGRIPCRYLKSLMNTVNRMIVASDPAGHTVSYAASGNLDLAQGLVTPVHDVCVAQV